MGKLVNNAISSTQGDLPRCGHATRRVNNVTKAHEIRVLAFNLGTIFTVEVISLTIIATDPGAKLIGMMLASQDRIGPVGLDLFTSVPKTTGCNASHPGLAHICLSKP